MAASSSTDTDRAKPRACVGIPWNASPTPECASAVECRWWDEQNLRWAGDGCVLLSLNGTHGTCGCTHLTSFALRMSNTVSSAGKILVGFSSVSRVIAANQFIAAVLAMLLGIALAQVVLCLLSLWCRSSLQPRRL